MSDENQHQPTPEQQAYAKSLRRLERAQSFELIALKVILGFLVVGIIAAIAIGIWVATIL